MIPFGFQLGQDHQGKNDCVLLETLQRLRLAQQDRGVENVGSTGDRKSVV